MQMVTDTERLLKESGFDLVGEYSRAVELAVLDQSGVVLDIATGSGRMACELAKAGFYVWSGDISEEALQKARLRLGDLVSRVKLFTFDGADTPFDSGIFQSITCANAIHEMENPQSVLLEMTRLLSDTGTLVLLEFNKLGFRLMDEIHRKQGRPEHRLGIMPEGEIDVQLRAMFEDVSVSDLGVNKVWIATGKRILSED